MLQLQQDLCLYVKARTQGPSLSQDTQMLSNLIAESERLLGAQSLVHLRGKPQPGDFSDAMGLWLPLPFAKPVREGRRKK